jgi:hypothetical protein
VLKSFHWVMNDVLKKDVRVHPPEVSLVHSRREAAELVEECGFNLVSYDFGARDMYVQAVVVANVGSNGVARQSSNGAPAT